MESIFVNKTFYAIGQGGFFLEVLKYENQEVVIVYDCGSVQSGDRLEKEIKNFGAGELVRSVAKMFEIFQKELTYQLQGVYNDIEIKKIEKGEL